MNKDNQTLLEDIAAVRSPDIVKEKTKPDRKRILSLIKRIQLILLPEYYHFQNYTPKTALVSVQEDLAKEIGIALNLDDLDPSPAAELADAFLQKLPHIMELINTDIQAIYDGDPAAKSKAEVILCYPGFYAISIYRIAHEMYALSIPYIPRIMTEYAHEKTGIDINPGAVIGEYFCIDHGTGIVIGETAVLGHHVKLYQGVTIGAKSFDLDADGLPVKGGKRHPDLGNHVIVYANATILGGTTVVGDDSIIGANVWLLHSVPARSTVYYQTSGQKEDAWGDWVI